MVLAPANAKITAVRTCVQDWAKVEKQAFGAEPDKSDEIREEGYRAYRRCFAGEAPHESYFPALVKQAKALVEKLP